MTREQAQERLNMLRTSAAHAFQEQNVPQQIPSGFTAGGMAGGSTPQQMAALSQRPQAPASNPMNNLQRVMQGQDSLQARHMLVAQGQQPQNGFASRVGQNLHPPGMGLAQGQGSLQQNFIQPSPSAPSANLQSSTAPTSQPTPPGGPQIQVFPNNFFEMPLQQLSSIYALLLRNVEEGEINLNAAGSTGAESDMQRQTLRARLDQKQILINLRDLINLKRQG
ncbi:hypothetical protein EI94DRAFT_1713078, partial [Lactarius quietus]